MKINGLLLRMVFGGMSCMFGMCKNKEVTAILSRKAKMEREERIALCIFICCEAVGELNGDDLESLVL